MALIEYIEGIVSSYIKYSNAAFDWYGEWGRQFLNILHSGFESIFYVLLFIAIVVSTLYYIMVVYNFFSRKKSKVYELNGYAPSVTIQIPTYNELAALNCAQRCLDFDYPGEYEILIGDDSNKPEISRKIKEFADMHDKVRVIKREKNVGFKPGNLNNMLKYSNGEFLVLFDSDFLPEKDFLRKIIAPFQYDKELSVVQSRWKILNPNTNMITMLGATMSKVFHFLVMPFVRDFGRIAFLCGSAEAIRKEHLIEVGGWTSGSLTEDIECSLRLLAKNKKLKYLNYLECECEVPYTPNDLYKQQMRWGYGVIHAVKKHFNTLFKTKMGARKKFSIFLFCSGYALSFLIMLLFLFGVLSFITHEPGPMDLPRFFGELGRNVILTSGLLVASLYAITKDREIKRYDKVLLSSLSYGLIVTLFVNIGIIKVLFNKPMKWYMLGKKGNEI